MEASTGQTLLGLPGPANASRDTFEHAILADGNRLSTLQGFIQDTGDDYSLLFAGRVYVDGVLECEQPLVPNKPPSSDPADILFASSQYQLYSGSIVPYLYHQVNQFTFVGWYGATVDITMAGYACTGLSPDLWEITATVQFVEPAVNIDLGNQTRCDRIPQIDQSDPNNPQLEWGGAQDKGVSFRGRFTSTCNEPLHSVESSSYLQTATTYRLIANSSLWKTNRIAHSWIARC